MIRYLFPLIFYFIVPGIAIAQSSDKKYSIQLFSTENGMPSNGIKGLQWNAQSGFLWMATEAGIVRYNGMEFKTFTNANTSIIATERIWFMTSNKKGQIFSADLAGNIFTISNNNLQPWHSWKNKRKAYGNIYKLLSVSGSFFSTLERDIAVPDMNTNFFDQLLPLTDTSCIVFNRNAVLLYTISKKDPSLITDSSYEIKMAFKIKDELFFIDANAQPFIFTVGEKAKMPLACIDGEGNTLLLNSKNSKLFWLPGMEAPVFIADKKAWLLEYENGKISATLIADNIPADAFISAVQYSRKNKMLFIATESRGLIVIRQNAVETKRSKNANIKSRNAYYAQVALANNNILTNEGDIVGDNVTAATTVPIKGKFGAATSITRDGLLWYTQKDTSTKKTYLYHYDPKSGFTRVYKKCQVNNQAFVVNSGNELYVATEKGLFLLKNDSLYLLHTFNASAQADDLVYDMQETRPGILAIATCKGLLLYDIKGKTLNNVFGTKNFCIRALWKYDDYLFMGTYGGGFFIMKDGKVKTMPLDINKYLLYTHCFVADNKGFCWLSTNRGLFKASLTDLINVFEGKSTTAYYHYYGKKDGMEMSELNGGCTPCALKLQNGDISFPSMDGLVWVDPGKPLTDLPEGEVYIDEVIIDRKKGDVEQLTSHSLSPTTSEIIFHLAFSAWCNKENIYLEYQLNDTVAWIPLSPENGTEIRCSGLSHGKYKLRIRKLNGFGLNNYTYKEINFSIRTPWYKTWWFYVLIFLASSALVALILHLRVKQYRIRQQRLEKQVKQKTQELLDQNEILEKNNTIKTRLISIISHDIVTPLKFVTVAGKNLIEKRSLMSEELQQETIKEITNTSQELQLLSTNILNWIKYQNENRRLNKETFSLYETIDQVLGILNSLARQKGLTIVNELDHGLRIHQYFEPLKILIYNLLTNAINFTEKGSITITSQQKGDELIITVKDEGVGMTADQINNVMADQFIVSSANIDNRKGNGLGYLIIKDLVKMMGATLTISSEKGHGTSVAVQFSIHKT